MTDMDTEVQRLMATEHETIIDGVAHLEHQCFTCEHGQIKGYAVRKDAHPWQRVLAHQSIETLTCQDHA